MNLQDFQGVFKYKLIIPSLYVLSWLAMIIGPILFPEIYEYYSFYVLVYLASKTLLALLIIINSWIRNKMALKRCQMSKQLQIYPQQKQIYHTFIIPNYQEQLQLISETLQLLAGHTRSKSNYLIFLAMEMHQDKSDQKAQLLIRKFANRFRLMQYTRHVNKQYEQKGKASNVSWCVEHIEPFLQKEMISPDNILLTIIDVDSWIPNAYIDQIQTHLRQNIQDKDIFVYMAPQIYTRNNLNVPFISRIIQYQACTMHCGILFSVFDITFPFSNYTLSYNLMKRVGFWDTVQDAIGEDFHTFQKCVIKTDGQAKSVPIFTPINQVNIQTGHGYCADFQGKFWQAQRHLRGVADVAYCFNMLFKTKFSLKKIILTITITQFNALLAIVPWPFISTLYQKYFLCIQNIKCYQKQIPTFHFYIVFGSFIVLSFLTLCFYEAIKRNSNRILYKRQNQSILKMFESMALAALAYFFVIMPAGIISAFGSLIKNREYRVAEKNVSRRNLQGEQNQP